MEILTCFPAPFCDKAIKIAVNIVIWYKLGQRLSGVLFSQIEVKYTM